MCVVRRRIFVSFDTFPCTGSFFAYLLALNSFVSLLQFVMLKTSSNLENNVAQGVDGHYKLCRIYVRLKSYKSSKRVQIGKRVIGSAKKKKGKEFFNKVILLCTENVLESLGFD